MGEARATEVPALDHLNFDASTPGMTDDTAVADSALGEPPAPPEDVMESPYQVRGADIPKRNAYVDYVPGRPPSAEELAAARKQAAKNAPSRRPTGPVLLEPEDYLNGEQTKVRGKERGEKLKAVAQSFYSKEKMQAWEKAMRAVNSATPEQLKEPDDSLKRAISIVKRGKPLTKKEAMRQAALKMNHRDV